MMPHTTDNCRLRGASDYTWSIQKLVLGRSHPGRRDPAAAICLADAGGCFFEYRYARRSWPGWDFSIFEWCFVMAGQSVPNS